MPPPKLFKHPNPDVLVKYREEINLSVDGAAHRMGISAAKLREIEASGQLPQSLVAKMARAYDLQVFRLLADEWVPTIRKQQDMRIQVGTNRQSDVETMLAVRRASDWQEAISQLVADDPTLRDREQLPTVDVTLGELSAESLGQRERERFGVSSAQQLQWKDTGDAFRHWRYLLESRFALVFAIDLGSACRGFSIWDEGASSSHRNKPS